VALHRESACDRKADDAGSYDENFHPTPRDEVGGPQAADFLMLETALRA
jgi:hypothetical protein